MIWPLVLLLSASALLVAGWAAFVLVSAWRLARTPAAKSTAASGSDAGSTLMTTTLLLSNASSSPSCDSGGSGDSGSSF